MNFSEEKYLVHSLKQNNKIPQQMALEDIMK